MPTKAHKLMSDVDMHRFVRWEVADIAARDALVVAVEDLHKVAYVTGIGEYYSLSVHDPMTWTSLSYTTSNPVVGISIVDGDIVFTFEDATTTTVVLPDDPVAVVSSSYDAPSNTITLTYSDATTDDIVLPTEYDGNPIENITVDDGTDELVITLADASVIRRGLPAVYAGNAVESITRDVATNELVLTFRDTTTTRVGLPATDPIGRAVLEGVAVDATGKLVLDGTLYTVAAYPALAAALGIPAVTTVGTTRTAGLPAGFTNFPTHLTSVIRADDGANPRWVAVSDSGTRISVIDDAGVVQWTDNNIYPNSQIVGYDSGWVYIATRGRNGTDFGIGRADPLVANSIEWYPGTANVSPIIYKEQTAYWNGFVYGMDHNGVLGKLPSPSWDTGQVFTSVGTGRYAIADDNWVWVFEPLEPYIAVHSLTDLQRDFGVSFYTDSVAEFDAIPCEDVARHYWQDANWLVTFSLTANTVYVLNKTTYKRDSAKETALAAITTSRTVGALAVLRGYGNGQGFIMTTGVDDTVYAVDVLGGWVVTETDIGASTIPDLAIIEDVAAVIPVGTDTSASNGYLDIVPAAEDFNVPNVSSGDPMLEWRIKAEE